MLCCSFFKFLLFFWFSSFVMIMAPYASLSVVENKTKKVKIMFFSGKYSHSFKWFCETIITLSDILVYNLKSGNSHFSIRLSIFGKLFRLPRSLWCFSFKTPHRLWSTSSVPRFAFCSFCIALIKTAAVNLISKGTEFAH